MQMTMTIPTMDVEILLNAIVMFLMFIKIARQYAKAQI